MSKKRKGKPLKTGRVEVEIDASKAVEDLNAILDDCVKNRNGTQSPPSGTILDDANKLIYGNRHRDYGEAKPAFDNLADQWSMYIRQKYNMDISLSAEDVCWMMVDLKKLRSMSTVKRDNYVDAAGYIGLIEKVEDLYDV